MEILRSSNKRISSHVALKKTVLETLNHPDHRDLYTMQFFLGNNRSWKCRSIDPVEKAQIYNYCMNQDKSFYVHANYPVLLGYPPGSDRQTNSQNFINSALGSLSGLPAGLICHIGKGADASIDHVINLVNSIQVPSGVGRVSHPLILENAAAQSGEIGSSLAELATIFHHVKSPSVGLCIDSQHSFASGLCDFRNPEAIESFFTSLDKYLPGRLQVIHLNDSEVPFGARKDRHGHCGLCQGHIWGRDDAGLKCLLKLAYQRELDLILETGFCREGRELLFKKYYSI